MSAHADTPWPSPYHPPPARRPGDAPELAPGTGVADPEATTLDTMPDLRGTIFLTVFLLMAIFGFWVLMTLELLNR